MIIDSLRKSRFTSYEMMQYILRALSYDNQLNSIKKDTFDLNGYSGSLQDLFYLVDEMATADGKISKKVDLTNSNRAWGGSWTRKSPGADTNLIFSEIDLFIEQFHILIARQILAPGNARDLSVDLPWFHVTEYGISCINERDILPYDFDGYLDRIMACKQLDDWDIYYLEQILKCFNNGIYYAATLLLGIEGEYLVEKLIKNIRIFFQVVNLRN